VTEHTYLIAAFWLTGPPGFLVMPGPLSA